jgi:Uma2 family endonuclease
VAWPNRQLTLQEWEALPAAEGVRLELVEGLVVMAPMPLFWHQRAAVRLGHHLDEQLPRVLTALAAVEVVVSDPPPTVRIPDIAVIADEVVARNPPRIAAAEAVLVVEILSDGTRRVDRMVKFAEYAEAGIPQYWIVDVGSPCSLLSYALVEGSYELSGEHTGRAELTVDGHPVTVDLDALTRR